MESLSSKFLVPAASTCLTLSGKRSRKAFRARNTRINTRDFALITCFKKSSYPDFQEYMRPSRLLQATEATLCPNTSAGELISANPSGKSDCLYIIKFQTSKIYGSGLTDTNSVVSLCLVDENGSSILQRIPVITAAEDDVSKDTLHFQQGRVDEFYFEGPNLGKIVAVWIGLGSGQWRIGGLSLTTILRSPDSSAEGLLYTFDVDEILLGEKTELSVLEIRPKSVTTFSGNEIDAIALSPSPSSTSFVSNEQSMKEYEDLKLSLLFYDAVLILAGSSLSSVLTVEDSYSYAFFFGGIFGFFYLLLLQRSVDGLPSQVLTPNVDEGGFGRILGTLKGPVTGLVVAFALAVVAAKLASGEDVMKLSPKEVVLGMLGFLMCKVSVVLSAFRPLPFRSRRSDGGA